MMIENLRDLHRETVQSDWIDYNGHMNVAYYVLAFDHAVDAFLDLLDMGEAYRRRTDFSTYVLEAHVNYLQEVKEGNPLKFSLRLLDHDPKRLHYFMEMHHADKGYLAATSEQLSLHVDLSGPRAAPMPQGVLERLGQIQSAHDALPRPERAGRVIGIRRKTV